MLEGFIEAFRTGHFSQALQLLDAQPTRPDAERQALRAELEFRLGRAPAARRAAERLLRRSTISPRAAARCHLVLGTACRDEGRLDEAQTHFNAAVDYAGTTNAVHLVCQGQIRMLSLLASGQSAPGVLSELRRHVYHAGDAHLLAALHICLAEIETRRGLTERAEEHVRSATTLLARDPNVFLLGTLAIARQCLALLRCDYTEARQQGLAALEYVRQSGNARTALAAHINLAHGLLGEGRLDLADAHIREAGRTCPNGGDAALGLLDLRAQAGMARGDASTCEALLQELERVVRENRLSRAYNRYWGLRTQLRLLCLLGNWARADRLVGEIGRSVPNPDDPSMSVALGLARAEVFLAIGRREDARRIIDEAGASNTMSLENQAYRERLAGQLRVANRDASALEHFERASRIYEFIGDRAARTLVLDDLAHALRDGRRGAHRPVVVKNSKAILSRLAALRQFADKPWLLATETFWLLSELEEDVELRLVAEGRSVVAVGARGATGPGGEHTQTLMFGDEGTKLHVRHQGEASVTGTVIAEVVETYLAASRAKRDLRPDSLWDQTFPGDEDGPIVISPLMGEIVESVRYLASTPIPILLTGETGTGKEVLARHIHRTSSYTSNPFVAFNCTTVPSELLDSQLFGHKKGAFTGADREFSGLIQAAHGGTLFLDEIGDMSRDLQPKLLRFLESGEIQPLGASRPSVVEVRVIAATNAPLDELVATGRFREDLFYRLSSVRYDLPPLRDRREEIPELARRFIQQFAQEFNKGTLAIANDTMHCLLLFAWPGNIRQLSNEIRRAVVLTAPNDVIRPGHLTPEVAGRVPSHSGPEAGPHVVVSLAQPLAEATQVLERAMLEHALERSSGRLDKAARLLRISRKGLYLKRQRYGLDDASDRTG